MDRIIEKIVKSANTPKSKEVLWLDISGEKPVFKHFTNGKWEVAASGGGGTIINGVNIGGGSTDSGNPDGGEPGEYTARAEYDKWYFITNCGVAAIYLPESIQTEPKNFCCTIQFTSENPTLIIVPYDVNDNIIMQDGFELETGTYEFNFVSVGQNWFITATKFADEPLALDSGFALIGTDLDESSDSSPIDNRGGLEKQVKTP